MKVNLKGYIEKIRTHLDLDVIPFSISIDETKLPKGILLLSAHKCIFGYASPNHAISIKNKYIEEVVFLFKGKWVDMVHAEEVKVAVIKF